MQLLTLTHTSTHTQPLLVENCMFTYLFCNVAARSTYESCGHETFMDEGSLNVYTWNICVFTYISLINASVNYEICVHVYMIANYRPCNFNLVQIQIKLKQCENVCCAVHAYIKQMWNLMKPMIFFSPCSCSKMYIRINDLFHLYASTKKKFRAGKKTKSYTFPKHNIINLNDMSVWFNGIYLYI